MDKYYLKIVSSLRVYRYTSYVIRDECGGQAVKEVFFTEPTNYGQCLGVAYLFVFFTSIESYKPCVVGYQNAQNVRENW